MYSSLEVKALKKKKKRKSPVKKRCDLLKMYSVAVDFKTFYASVIYDDILQFSTCH